MGVQLDSRMTFKSTARHVAKLPSKKRSILRNAWRSFGDGYVSVSSMCCFILKV